MNIIILENWKKAVRKIADEVGQIIDIRHEKGRYSLENFVSIGFSDFSFIILLLKGSEIIISNFTDGLHGKLLT